MSVDDPVECLNHYCDSANSELLAPFSARSFILSVCSPHSFNPTKRQKKTEKGQKTNKKCTKSAHAKNALFFTG